MDRRLVPELADLFVRELLVVGLDLLQAQHVRLGAAQPVEQARQPGGHRVDVPGRDPHALYARCVARGYRFAARPAWLGGHLVVVALAVTMILLGHWQLTVSERKGFSLQNFGYALQWWAFTLFGVLLWAKILRDHARSDPTAEDVTSPAAAPSVDEPVAYRRYVMPQSADGPPEPADDVHAAYNEYLRSLSEHG